MLRLSQHFSISPSSMFVGETPRVLASSVVQSVRQLPEERAGLVTADREVGARRAISSQRHDHDNDGRPPWLRRRGGSLLLCCCLLPPNN
jgi:hypothetical protein